MLAFVYIINQIDTCITLIILFNMAQEHTFILHVWGNVMFQQEFLKKPFFSQNDWYCTSSVLLKEYIYDNFCKRRTEVVDLCVCSLYINTPVCILCPWHTCVYSLFLTHLFTCQICPTHLYVLQPGLRHLVFGHYFMPLVLGLQSVDKFNLFALRKSIRKNIPFQHKKSLPCNQ